MGNTDCNSKLKELHERLESQVVPTSCYRLQGLYGSVKTEDNLSLDVKKGEFRIEYYVYYMKDK
jgi:hypothetical protein